MRWAGEYLSRSRTTVADCRQEAPRRCSLPSLSMARIRSGLGLGLFIARRSVEADAGTLSVRDVPGTGCVFTISLPRYPWP